MIEFSSRVGFLIIFAGYGIEVSGEGYKDFEAAIPFSISSKRPTIICLQIEKFTSNFIH